MAERRPADLADADSCCCRAHHNQHHTDFFSTRMDLSGGCYVWHLLYNWDFAQSCVK